MYTYIVLVPIGRNICLIIALFSLEGDESIQEAIVDFILSLNSIFD